MSQIPFGSVPFCSRRSLFLGFMKIHIQLAHPGVDICVSPQRWTVGREFSGEPKTETKVGFVPLVRLEDVERFTELNKITESNGEDLIHELDVDDEFQYVVSPASESDDLLEFRCLHCHFRGANPAVVKCHILASHPDDDVTILDMRTTRRMNHEHLFMCRSVECQFVSSVQSEFDLHMRQKPSHIKNNLVHVPIPDNRKLAKSVISPDTRSRTRGGNKTPLSTTSADTASARRLHPHHEQYKSNAARAVNGPEAVREMASQSRRTAEGSIEYNDDGTIKGVELVDDGSGSACIQCQHCEYRSTDLIEMKSHLWNGHARMEPLAIDVNAAIAGLHSWLFFCPVNSCGFVAGYFNIYKHHMDVEHPGSEVGFSGKNRSSKRRSNSAGGGGRRTSSAGRDPSFTVSVQNSSERHSGRKSLIASDLLSESANESSPASSSAAVELVDSPVGGTPQAICFDYKTFNKTSHRSAKERSKFDFSRRYECVLCNLAVATLADMKTHLLAAHDTSVVHQCIDRRARQLRKRQKILFCPQSTCSYCCKFDDDLVRHIALEHPGSAAVGMTVIKDSTAAAAAAPKQQDQQLDLDDGCVYQCSYCTYITTDLQNVREHVLNEHAAGDGGGFAAIKTAVGSDGNVVMSVNDAAMSDDNSSQDHCDVAEAGDHCDSAKDDDSQCDNGVKAVEQCDGVQVADENASFAVL
jgi:hypothetical protein